MSGLKSLWNIVCRSGNHAVEMSSEDCSVIVAFARGAEELRDKAIAIHRKYIPALGARGNMLQEFMAEVDKGSPDIYLRGIFRKCVLDAYPA